jgi:hypothetical protein
MLMNGRVHLLTSFISLFCHFPLGCLTGVRFELQSGRRPVLERSVSQLVLRDRFHLGDHHSTHCLGVEPGVSATHPWRVVDED